MRAPIVQPSIAELPAVLGLIRSCFAYMDGRIDPPSSVHKLTLAGLEAQAELGRVWVIGAAPIACMVLVPNRGRLYLGKVAIASDSRGLGLLRRLIAQAVLVARENGLQMLELETRIELTEVHAAFEGVGFSTVREGNHHGYTAPTYFVMQRPC